MNTNWTSTFSTLALVASIGYVTVSNAQSGNRIDRQEWLSKQEIESRLTQLGYEVRKLEAEDGCVEAKVIESGGARSELYVDPLTGEPGCGGKTLERDD